MRQPLVRRQDTLTHVHARPDFDSAHPRIVSVVLRRGNVQHLARPVRAMRYDNRLDVTSLRQLSYDRLLNDRGISNASWRRGRQTSLPERGRHSACSPSAEVLGWDGRALT